MDLVGDPRSREIVAKQLSAILGSLKGVEVDRAERLGIAGIAGAVEGLEGAKAFFENALTALVGNTLRSAAGLNTDIKSSITSFARESERMEVRYGDVVSQHFRPLLDVMNKLSVVADAYADPTSSRFTRPAVCPNHEMEGARLFINVPLMPSERRHFEALLPRQEDQHEYAALAKRMLDACADWVLQLRALGPQRDQADRELLMPVKLTAGSERRLIEFPAEGSIPKEVRENLKALLTAEGEARIPITDELLRQFSTLDQRQQVLVREGVLYLSLRGPHLSGFMLSKLRIPEGADLGMEVFGRELKAEANAGESGREQIRSRQTDLLELCFECDAGRAAQALAKLVSAEAGLINCSKGLGTLDAILDQLPNLNAAPVVDVLRARFAAERFHPSWLERLNSQSSR